MFENKIFVRKVFYVKENSGSKKSISNKKLLGINYVYEIEIMFE